MEAMEKALRAYLKTCQLEISVYIRGTRFREWTYKNRLVGQLPFGKIYLNKSKCSDGVLVRVNGVQMFTRCTASTWQIVLEINPEQSRETLTSNRDGLIGEAANELDRFIGKIWVNPVSGTRGHFQKTVNVFGNTVYQVHDAPRRQTEHPSDPVLSPHAASPRPNNHNGTGNWEYPATTDRTPLAADSLYTKNLTNAVSNGADLSQSLSSQDRAPATACYVHVVDCSSAELIRAAKNFLPDQIGGIRGKLLQKWTDACAVAATELAKIQHRSFSFRTGFVFNEEDLGRCTQDGSIYTLLLNPVTNKGLLRYKLSSKTDSGIVQAIAAHEAVHMLGDLSRRKIC